MMSSPVDETALRKFLDMKPEKSLPASVFIEVITHFRNNPDVLQQLLQFRYEKGLSVYNNIPDDVFDDKHMTALSVMGKTELMSYAVSIVDKKIDIESKFTLLFYEITRDLYAHYRLENDTAINSEDKGKILTYIARNGFKDCAKDFENRLKAELQSGYQNDNEKSMQKDFYIKELNEACIFIDLTITGCKSCRDEDAGVGE